MAAKKTKTKTKSKKPKESGKSARQWSSKIHTVSTFPPEGTFTKDAKSVARILASKKVSPKGIGSGIRMLTMYINRAGKNLDPKQKKELEEAKHILQKKEHPNGKPKSAGRKSAKKKSTKKSAKSSAKPLKAKRTAKLAH